MKAKNDIEGAQTLIKGLSIIEAVAQGNCTLVEIIEHSELAKSTAHRLTLALVGKEYLRQISPGKYALGRELITLGFQAHSEIDLVTLAHPHLIKLSADTRETVHMGILADTEVFYIDKIAGTGQIQMASKIGCRLPAQFSGLGKALIAALPRDQWGKFFNVSLARSPYAIKEKKTFIRNLEETLKRGYSIDLEEGEAGICCVGTAIRDVEDNVVAAISVTRATRQENINELLHVAPMIMQTAARISYELGNAKVKNILTE
jgi:DNA-binding IclR family transcriptional regulator